jgi:uncharacterized delta-60 repeat protein
LLVSQLASLGQAAPGDLDYTFGGFGSQAIVTSTSVTAGMAMAPDGKIVTVGFSGVQLVVRRYRPDGSLDPGFGTSGVATLLNPAYGMRPATVTVQPDGKIVVAGTAENSTDDFLVARVNSNGTIDDTFANGGYRATDFAGQGDHAYAVLVQPDGKIVAAGTSTVGGDTDFSVARYTASGSPDGSFSGDGRITFGFGGDEECRDMALQDDGKIVVVGDGSEEFPNYDRDVCVGRLNPDGTLDGSFDGDGQLSTGLGDYDQGNAAAIQADGKILIAGISNPADPSGKLLRLHPNGVPDASFGGDGIVGISGSKWLNDVLVQPDGAYLALGDVFLGNASERRFAVFRRLPNGSEDPSFSGDGEALYDLGAFDEGLRLALLPDGRILAYGTTGPDPSADAGTVMVRLWPDGTPDGGGYQAFAFNENGIPAGTGFPPGSSEELQDLAVQPDGKLVAVGAVIQPTSGESDFAVARFMPDGELDTSFGLYGHATFSFHNLDYATGVAIQPDGKIVVGGYTGPSASGNINFLVARFLPDGTLDPTFGFSGFNVIDFLGGSDYAYAIALAPDGKIVLAGTVYNGVHDVMGVARFTSDGIADVSFDLDAKQLVEFDPGAVHTGRSVLVQPDLKIVVGGDVGGDFAIMRLTESGNLDDTFGCQGGIGGGGACDGRARIDMGGADYAYGIGRAPNGYLYLGGYRIAGSSVNFAIAQFSENGSLLGCPPFPCENWPSGKAYLNFNDYDTGFAMDVRADGQIVLAGRTNGMFAWGQFGPTNPVAHLTAVTDLPGQELALAVRFVGNGRLVVAGQQNFNGDINFMLAKYETTPDPTVGVAESPLPEASLFEALGPNPTREGANLTFTLSRSSAAKLLVHDVGGRLLRMETTGPLPPGRHQLRWDGRAADGSLPAAGVLFVSLEAEGRPIGRRTLVVVR